MREDVKAQWLTDLRSGEFKQGRGALNNWVKDTHCALGVLYHKFRYQLESDPLSRETAGKGWFTNAAGLTGLQVGIIAHLNDTDKKSFEEIADWIEKNVTTET